MIMPSKKQAAFPYIHRSYGPDSMNNATTMLSPEQVRIFQNEVWDFYQKNKRNFPWRETTDPYPILVSELMLQQTQTQRVIPKFIEWMRIFPTLQSLAAASRAQVLAYWNGLGYNRRAIYLQRAAGEICSRFQGNFPVTEAELQSLPGIGAYTAGAICAFAYNQPAVFVETNIRSLFIHYFFPKTDEKLSDKVLSPLVAQTLDTNDPRQWYYALMDFGAELKKRVGNPSRKSKTYTKQSRFAGSLRQARGAIIRQLSQKKSMGLAEISRAENIEIARLQKASEGLLRENIIAKNGNELSIKE